MAGEVVERALPPRRLVDRPHRLSRDVGSGASSSSRKTALLEYTTLPMARIGAVASCSRTAASVAGGQGGHAPRRPLGTGAGSRRVDVGGEPAEPHAGTRVQVPAVAPPLPLHVHGEMLAAPGGPSSWPPRTAPRHPRCRRAHRLHGHRARPVSGCPAEQDRPRPRRGGPLEAGDQQESRDGDERDIDAASAASSGVSGRGQACCGVVIPRAGDRAPRPGRRPRRADRRDRAATTTPEARSWTANPGGARGSDGNRRQASRPTAHAMRSAGFHVDMRLAAAPR